MRDTENEAIATVKSKRRGKRMKNVATYGTTHVEEKCRYYSWLEDYLERLEGKEAYREFQERHYGTSEYYALMESLMA